MKGEQEREREKEGLAEEEGGGEKKKQERQRWRKSINTLVNESQLFTPRWASPITDCVQDADCRWQLKMNRVHRHTQKDAHTCASVSLHALSPRQQFAADLLISIATFTAVGDGDIMKIDCHKKRNSTAGRGQR